MSVDCGLAQNLLKKLGDLEKRVTYQEEESNGQQDLIEKLQRKLRKLKKTTTYRNKGKLSKKKPGAIIKQEWKEEIDSINNEPLKSIQYDSKLNQRTVVRMGVRCDKVNRRVLNPAEKIVEHGPSSKTECTQRQRDAKTVEISSKPKRSVKKPHICNFCSKSFQGFEDLSRHIRVHTGERPFKCKICSKSFKQLGDLKKHSRTHTGEKPFSCLVCSRTFAASSTLKRHTRIHTGEKPYGCSYCSKTFTHYNSRNYHIRTHLGEKPYSCTVCSKAFANPSNLFRHRKIHTGEKPYSCSICSKKISTTDNRKRHERTHSGELSN